MRKSSNKRLFLSLGLYFLIALLWTDSIWTLLTPKIQAVTAIRLPVWSVWIGLMGPGLSAVLCSLFLSQGIRELLQRLIQWRANWILYPAIVFGTFCYYLASYGLSLLVYPQISGPTLIERLQSYTTPIFHLSAPFGLLEVSIIYGLCEELGWRGYALPRLLSFLNPFWATLVLNIFVTIWHLPLIEIAGHALTVPAIAQYFLHSFLVAICLTWVYLAANRSLFITSIFHGSLNFFGSFFPETNASFAQGHNLPSNLLLAFFAFCFLVPTLRRSIILKTSPSQLGRVVN